MYATETGANPKAVSTGQVGLNRMGRAVGTRQRNRSAVKEVVPCTVAAGRHESNGHRLFSPEFHSHTGGLRVGSPVSDNSPDQVVRYPGGRSFHCSFSL